MYVRMYKKNAIVYYSLFYTHEMYFFYITYDEYTRGFRFYTILNTHSIRRLFEFI